MQVEQLRHLAALYASHPAFCADTPFAWSGGGQSQRSVDMSYLIGSGAVGLVIGVVGHQREIQSVSGPAAKWRSGAK